MSGTVLDTKGIALALCWETSKEADICDACHCTSLRLLGHTCQLQFFHIWQICIGWGRHSFFLLCKKKRIVYITQGKWALFSCHMNTEKELAFLHFFHQFIPSWEFCIVGKHSITLTDPLPQSHLKGIPVCWRDYLCPGACCLLFLKAIITSWELMTFSTNLRLISKRVLGSQTTVLTYLVGSIHSEFSSLLMLCSSATL